MPNISLEQARVVDPVATQVVHGYANSQSVANFVAPVVPVNLRAGKIIKFTKESFLLTQTRRAPGGRMNRLSVGYSNDEYTIKQHGASAAVPFEQYEEANEAVQINLRDRAIIRTAAAIEQSWEQEVTSLLTDATKYEADCQEIAAGTRKFSDPASDPEKIVNEWAQAIRAQIGTKPNSAVITSDVYDALRFHPIFRDRVKYTSDGSVTLDMLSRWLGFSRGIRVSDRVYATAENQPLVDFMTAGTMVPFFSPEGDIGAGFLPVDGADNAVPAAFYTYSLTGYPVAIEERYDADTGEYVTDLFAEQSIQPVGLGANGKIGAAFLATALV